MTTARGIKRFASSGVERLRRMHRTWFSPRLDSVLATDDATFLTLFDPVTAGFDSSTEVPSQLTALLDHFQARTLTDLPPIPEHMVEVASMPQAELIDKARRIVAHRFDLASEPEVGFGERIDWNFDPTADPRRRWCRELHRHRWVAILAEAYQQTVDESFAVEFSRLIADWIRSNPPPSRKDEGHVAWTLMGVGMRCAVWPSVFFRFSSSSAFDRTTRLLMLRSIHDHASFLHLFKTHNNHLLRESNGLLNIAIYFPEFRDAVQWKEMALGRLDRELQDQINPDGSHIEMSIGYQWLVAEEFDATFDMTERAQWRLPSVNLRRAMEAIYEYIVYTCRPDGTWPQLSDGFLVPHATLRRQLHGAGERLGRADFSFIATQGNVGVPPRETSRLMPYGGLAVMRSGWSGDAHYLIMDAAPFGGVHGHEDRLSIEVSVFGRPVIVDPGTYTYNANDPYRTYFTGSDAHNTVLVDGLGQVRRWQPAHLMPRAGICPPIGWISNDQVDFVQASYDDGYGKYRFQRPNRPEIARTVRHQRSVLFVKPSYWVIVDTMHAEGSHEYQRHFQAAAGIDVELMEHGARFVGPNDVGALLMKPVDDCAQLTTVRGCEDPIGGWISDGTRNHKQPATQLHLAATAAGSTSLVTLIYPIRSRQTEVRLTRVALSDGSGLGLCVEGIDGEDQLVFRNGNESKPDGEGRACVYMAGYRKRNGRTNTLFEIDDQPMKALELT